MNQAALLHRTRPLPACRLLLLLACIAFLAVPEVLFAADRPQPGKWGDQGDGTYFNPVVPADFSDLDVIRLGSTYVAISSTIDDSPGMIVLTSPDLVNWTLAAHVVSDLTRISPDLASSRMAQPGGGIWAGAIREHKGRLSVYFGTPRDGIFLSTALSVSGPWTPPRPVIRGPGWDDPCPFWDDDGQGYLVATHFAPEGRLRRRYGIHLFRLTASGDAVVPRSGRVIHRSRGSEANKLYKIHGLYYHFYSEVRAEGRVPMMERARSLRGPWQRRQLMHVDASVDKEPNQGGFVQLPSGAWYFLTHQGHGDWEGRAGVLLPVTWLDGWPIPGTPGPDGIGRMLWHAAKPIQGFPRTEVSASDSFDGPVLAPAWEWHYQPDPRSWSLAEHPGFLRLRAFPPLTPGDPHTIGNLLTQRALRTLRNQVTIRLELGGMADGQRAGLAHFSSGWCALEVAQSGGHRILTYDKGDGRSISGPTISDPVLFLRSEWDFAGRATFAWSSDGQRWQPFGQECTLGWGGYRGDRVALFTTNERGAEGSIDVDFFRYQVAR